MTSYTPPSKPIAPRIPRLDDSGSTALRGSPIKLPEKIDLLPIDHPPGLSAGYLPEIDWFNLVNIISLHTGQEELVRYDRALFQKLYELYRIEPDQEKPVRQYIDTHSVLLNALIEIYPCLQQYFGRGRDFSLTVFVDPEEDFERLFIEITLNVSAPEAFKLRRQFYRGCFSRYPFSVKSHLSTDIRLI